MSLLKTRTWWSQKSLAQSYNNKSLLFSESSKIIRKESIMPDDKHTFFPGNEISGNRILNNSQLILRPDSLFKILMDSLILITTIMLAIIIPYSISYFSDIPKGIYYTCSLFFFFDILICLNTSFYEKGKLITDRKKIIKNYLKHWLILDTFSGFPCEIFIPLDCNFDSPKVFYFRKDYLRLFLTLKLLKIGKIRVFVKTIKGFSTDSSFFAGIMILINVVFIATCIHWVNCFYNMLYAYQLELGYEYWPEVRYTNSKRYLVIFEKIVQTLTSVGYGDFLPLTVDDKLFSMILMAFTSGYFGYFIGKVEQIVANSTKFTIYFRKVKSRFVKLCEKHKLNKKLRLKINAYIRHLIDTYKNHSVQDEDFIKFLSIPLREQIFLCTKGYVLITVPFFKSLSRPCIRAIGYKMMLRLYGPEDIIFTESELKPEMYFINSGTIQIFHFQSETIFIELSKDNIFGELAFLLNQSRCASARSANFSELLCLNRFDIDKILSIFPKDNQKFLTTIWNLKNYGISYLDMTCYLCGSNGHVARNCGEFIWKPNIDARKRHSEFDKRINVEYTPKLPSRGNKTCKVLHHAYNVNGRNAKVDKMFRKNPYLINKAKEYSKQLDYQRNNFSRVFQMIDEEKSNCESSNESEKNLIWFKCLDMSPVAPYCSSLSGNSDKIHF